MHSPLSAVEPFEFRGRVFYVKRDDTIHPYFSGNKFRKLYSLLHTPAAQYERVVSYGGTQSNAMLSIAALCRRQGWAFDYYAKPVPEHLRSLPTGNLKQALALGMALHEFPHDTYPRRIRELAALGDDTTLVIPQGGADRIARKGVAVLAEEVRGWLLKSGKRSGVTVVTPSGTGTTAYFLAEAMPEVRVITTPAVGSGTYLEEQMRRLGPLPANLRIIGGAKKHHFAKPYPELLRIWQELRDAGIEFDLVYGAKMWYELMQLPRLEGGTLLYIHSGGLIGNETMLERYRYKKMV